MDHQQQREAAGQAALKALHLEQGGPGRATPFRRYRRDFVFAEIWPRPGLGLAERWVIALSCVGYTANGVENERYAHGALASGALNLGELREAVLQFAVYCGWYKAELLDDAISRAADRLGIAEPSGPAPVSQSVAERSAQGSVTWQSVMTFPPPTTQDPYTAVGILPHVFGEMWDRPGLSRKLRRIITVACCGLNDAEVPIRAHVYASLNSGDVTIAEMGEFALHYAAYTGWPKASDLQALVFDVIARMRDGRWYMDTRQPPKPAP
ncbi:carboxymuconolactone decarboxylase family protein [Novosphingobium bradum]|uniref:Carboxymuconolactone decarboxylase family protein n=1 Tax=Novosphingobium bradum TaxID=1737444 RepID=A0ABV7IR11_9SPHN